MVDILEIGHLLQKIETMDLDFFAANTLNKVNVKTTILLNYLHVT